jgi:hypothetical protein
VRFAIALIALGTVAAGCVHAEDVARTRAASDFHCEEDKIDVTNIGGTSYRAKGCGYNTVYDCTGSQVGGTYNGAGGGTTDYVCVPEHESEKDE